MSHYRYVKRPRTGDTIVTRYGNICRVTRVYGHGERLDIVDPLGRDWSVERASVGNWVRSDA